jgi:4,5-DOPA dioxygenase extradiol
MSSFPSVFISHGSPELPLQSAPVTDFLKQLGVSLGRPKAILCVSAHWLSRRPAVSAAAHPETIHDFYGFSPELHQLKYPAPGAPEQAERVSQLLNESGIDSEIDPQRGLDHGAWTPLMLMYPDSDVPVTQLSLQPHLGTAHHFHLGQVLAPLRQEGVLIVASGAATHNLRMFGAYPFEASPPEWVAQFDQWLTETVTHQRVDDLLDYRHTAPHAAQNHPSEEHFLPLFVAMGAGGTDPKATHLHSSFTYGVFSMSAFAFS